MITTIKLTNVHLLVQLSFFWCVSVRTLKIYPLGKFQVYHTESFTMVTTLYIRCLELTHLA